ncbi:hypothetical protein JCM33374_g1913 [Metschnikowia sp. JCM 33374]|nr:hypothetical protein JCM33374_g1913 [Metschnikowia sp. JCM 33374]
MGSTADERTELMLRLRDIEHQDKHRKSLIWLCVMRALSFGQDTHNGNGDNVAKTQKNAELKAKSPSLSSSVTPSSHPSSDGDVQKKIHAFEVQVASLKMQLSTKEQAHAAKVDELKNEIERLSKGNGGQSSAAPTASVTGASKPRPTRGRPRLVSRGSPVSKQTKPVSSFFANSPFSDSKTGKGNSFSGAGISSLTESASFKLSRSDPKPTPEVFSPNNSSAESTPRMARHRSEALGESSPIGSRKERRPTIEGQKIGSQKIGSQKIGSQKIDGQKIEGQKIETQEKALDHPATDSLASSVNSTVSDPEETFQSANATFDVDKDKKNRRKKIRLVSSEASKLILASSGKTLDGEGDDLNSFKYYQDDNFGTDALSPVAPRKRPSSAEPVVKKKHVFKIG